MFLHSACNPLPHLHALGGVAFLLIAPFTHYLLAPLVRLPSKSMRSQRTVSAKNKKKR